MSAAAPRPSPDGPCGDALPWRIEFDGRIAPGRPDPVADTVRPVVETRPGERPLLPAFGCRVHELGPLRGAADRAIAAALIEEALARWAPRLAVRRVDVVDAEPAEADGAPGRLLLRVHEGPASRELDVLWQGGRDEDDAAGEPGGDRDSDRDGGSARGGGGASLVLPPEAP